VKEKRKRKEKKRILNIDLAVRASQWLREAVYDKGEVGWVPPLGWPGGTRSGGDGCESGVK